MTTCYKPCLWDFFDELMLILNIDYRFSQKRTVLWEYEVMNIKCNRKDIKIVMYLNNIVNYHIWKMRNRCIYEGYQFDFVDIISRLIKSVGARKRLQASIYNDELKVGRLDEIISAMIMLHDLQTNSF